MATVNEFKYTKTVGKTPQGKEVFFYVREDAKELFDKAPEGTFTRMGLADYIVGMRDGELIKSRMPVGYVLDKYLGVE